MVGSAGAKASLRVPALVWEAPTKSSSDSGHWMITDAGQSLRRPRTGEPLVMLVEKAPGRNNPFAMGVTIGRVESNDIIVDDRTVSRFHAWIQYDERLQAWQITDAESKNGTWVNGKKLAGKQRVTLAGGAEIKLGDVLLRFMLPDALLAFVDEASRR
jgi:hypothetical protein